MRFVEQFIPRYEFEQKTTRRLLAALPEDAEQLAWQPHPKSMTLGRLAWHLAEISRYFAPQLLADEVSMGGPRPDPPQDRAEILAGFDETVRGAVAAFRQIDNERFTKVLAMRTPSGKTVVEMPVAGWLNTFILDHTIHHRGQFSVYLRLLDVPVPSIYGPTADSPMSFE